MPPHGHMSKYSNPNNRSNKKSKTFYTKRASFCPLPKGSITVEAAFAIPIFFLALVALFYTLEVMSVRTTVRCGMQYAAKSAVEDVYVIPTVSPAALQGDLVNAIGADSLNRTIIVGGASGLDCNRSIMSPFTGVLEMKVDYKVKLPIPMFAVPPVSMSESLRMKGWNGYTRTGWGNENSDMVYVTQYGMVYHQSLQCSYLDLSIHPVNYSEIQGLRNQSAGKYHACEYCGWGAKFGTVYITNYGDRYHTSLACGGLKRTISQVPISEAVGKGACSKCCK